MAVQTSYRYFPYRGAAGSLYDISPHLVDSRSNAEQEDGVVRHGLGVVRGTSPGNNVRLPATGSTAETFEGLVLNGGTTEMNIQGETILTSHATLSVLRYGRAWALIPENLEVTYGQQVHLILTGADRGKFTNVATSNLALNATFIGPAGSGSTAPIELYNQRA